MPEQFGHPPEATWREVRTNAFRPTAGIGRSAANRSGWGEVAVIFCNRLSRLHPIPIRLQVQVSSIDLAGERLYQERFHGTHAKSPLNT